MNLRAGVAHLDEGPRIEAVSEVATPTLVGLCVGSALFVATLAAVSCVCYRRRLFTEQNGKWRSTLATSASLQRKKKAAAQNETSLPLRKTTTAVRSPSSGPAGPVLKKTPSPTGPGTVQQLRTNPPSPQDGVQAGPICKNNSTLEESEIAKKQAKEIKLQKASIKCYVENEKERDKSPAHCKEDEKDTQEKEVTEEKSKNNNINNQIGKLGQLNFRLKYSPEKHALLVTILRCTNLPAKDVNMGTSDPYVKLQLLPEKQHKVKTRVLRKTLNPVYDEDFTFYGLNPNQLRATTLHFVVLSFDRYSRDDVIGEVICPLSSTECDGLEDQQISLDKEISPRNLKIRSQGRGELLVSLCHQPAANRLTVVVLKARNLPKMDITGLCDPYVKMYLLYNNQRIAKKKTHVKKRTINPVFNESFVFDVPYNEGLSNLSLEFLVLDWDRVTKNEVIGRLELGPKAIGAPQQHWLEVCGAPRRQIAEWHKLRD